MPFSYVDMMRGFGYAEYAELPDFRPVTPAAVRAPLSDARIGLFATVGAQLPTQRPFAEINDLSFRLVPTDVPVSELVFGHPSPIRGFAERDLNVAFPRDRLAELAAAGTIGDLAPSAVSMLGSITRYTELAEQTAPMIAQAFVDQDVDAVLLVPFCPACHRATALVARALEARGLPCVMLTVLREMAEAFKPARPVFLDYPLGATAGRPGDHDDQRSVLRSALAVLDAPATPWRIHDLDRVWAPDGSRAWEDDVRALYADTGRAIHRARVDEHISAGEALAGREDTLDIACAC